MVMGAEYIEVKFLGEVYPKKGTRAPYESNRALGPYQYRASLQYPCCAAYRRWENLYRFHIAVLLTSQQSSAVWDWVVRQRLNS